MNEEDRKANAKFLEWIEDYEDWYGKESTRWIWILFACKVLAIGSSLLSFVMAAIINQKFFFEMKGALIAVTLLSAASSEVLAQFKVREMESLREEGHLEIAALAAEARQKFAELSNDRAACFELMNSLRGRVASLEERQHRKFVDLEKELGKGKSKAKRDAI